MTVTIKTNKNADQEFILEPCPLTSCELVSHVVGKGNSCFLTIINDEIVTSIWGKIHLLVT